MGVPGLFKQIVQKYKGIYSYNRELTYKHLYIDFNSFIYEAYADVVHKFREAQKRNARVKWSNTFIEKRIINTVLNLTTHLICDVVQPTKMVYIAIDGPAPRAKMVQQRARRYKKVMEQAFKRRLSREHSVDMTDIWDSSKISPGTPFMAELSKALQSACKSGQFSKHTLSKGGKPIRILLSDGTVPGEGEHKFNSNLAKKSGNVCIYSNDGDLIILANRFATSQTSTGIKRKNITILRAITPNDPLYDKDLDHDYAFLYVKRYREAMIEEMELNVYDSDRVMYDFMFMSFFGGNDFVHAFPFTEMRDRHTLTTLLQIYKDLLYKFNGEYNLAPEDTDNASEASQGCNTDTSVTSLQPPSPPQKAVYLVSFGGPKGDEPKLHHKFFVAFMVELAKREGGSLKRKYERMIKYHPRNDEAEEDPAKRALLQYEHRYYYDQDNPYYEKYHDEFTKINYTLEKHEWKRQYYEHFFGVDSGCQSKTYNWARTKICKHYIESLLFTMKYYLKGLPSWTWYNEARVAPIPSDVVSTLKYIDDVNSLGEFKKGKSFTPQEQLMLILPPGNRILPKPVNDLMRRRDLVRFYPKQFELDVVAGGKHIYSDPILPDIDAIKVLNAYRMLPQAKGPLNKLNRKPLMFN